MRLKVSNVCQLLDKSKYPATQTKQGVTYTNDGNGIITINGTNTASYLCVFVLNVIDGKPGHKYMQLGATDDGFWNTYGLECKWIDGDGVGHGFTMTNGIMSIPSDVIVRNIYVSALVCQGYTVSNKTFKPQLFDLTEMYGAGHEPTTVAQFRQDFPNEMYEYSPVCWKKFRRLKYVTETKNLFKFSNEVGTLTGGFGPNVARNFEEGKWYIGFTTNNYYSPNNIIAYSFKDNLIYYNGNGAGYGLSRAFKCEPNSNYNISCLTIGISGSDLGFIYAGFYDESGNYISNNNIDINNRSFTTPANCKWLIIVLSTRGTAEVYFKDIQVEEGSTASPYQPYGYLPLNRGKYIANKEPVQLLDKSKYPATQTINGVTFTNNGDGTITANGTATGLCQYKITNSYKKLIGENTNKCLLVGSISANSGTPYYLQLDFVEGNSWSRAALDFGKGVIFTNSDSSTQLLSIIVKSGVTVNNLVFKPQLFDLTEMYGAGNEPTTVAQFRADYPNELYDYNPYNAITFR